MGNLQGQNPHHPQKGSVIVVNPIMEMKDIQRIKRMLKDKPRDLLLFTMGINNGLRVGDLLKLKVKDVAGLKVGEVLKIREGKTGKTNVLMLNKGSHKVLHSYLSKTSLDGEDFLFKSKGKSTPITTQTVNKMVKKWCEGIRGNFGCHSLRKTFGYVQRKKYGVGFEILCKRFSHSSPSITMRYLGIQDKEINEILMNEI